MARTTPLRTLLPLFALVALLSSACVEGSPAGPVVSLIPKDAAIALVAEKPAQLYAALERFWTSARVATIAGGELETFVAQIPNRAAIEKSLDAARPWAVAFVPAEPGSKELRALVYLPYRGQNIDALRSLAGDRFQLLYQAKKEGYVIFGDESYPLSFPPKEARDLKELARYPANALKIWADPVALKRLATNDFEAIKAEVRRLVGSGGMASRDTALKALENGALSLLAELGSADAALVFSSEGLLVRIGANALAGASMEKLFARAALAPSALEWAGQVSAEALYGYAWSIEPTVATELSALYLKLLSSGLVGQAGDEGQKLATLVERYAALMAKWSALSGPRGAASFDLDIDPAVIAALDSATGDGQALSEALATAFALRLEAFQEVKDEAQYRKLVQNMAQDPELAAILSQFSELFGMSMELAHTDKKEGAFAYGELGFSLRIIDEAKFGAQGESAEAARAALEAVARLFTLRYATSKGRIVISLGSPAELKALADRAAAPHAIAADPTFVSFSKQLPARVQLIGSLSMRRLAGMIVKALPAGQGSAFDPAGFSNWYSYLALEGRAGASRLETGFMLPAGDFAAAFGLFATIKSSGSGGISE